MIKYTAEIPPSLYTVRVVTVLIICIGNIARGDDGAAHRVARLLAQRDILPAGTRVIEAVGLDVAMAADVAEADLFILIDAVRRESPLVRLERLDAGPALTATGHSIDPPSLLTVTEGLYGRVPPAWIVSLAAPEMGHTESLSNRAEAASVEAASVVVSLIDGKH
jgi:hydrogenase maturation protease